MTIRRARFCRVIVKKCSSIITRVEGEGPCGRPSSLESVGRQPKEMRLLPLCVKPDGGGKAHTHAHITAGARVSQSFSLQKTKDEEEEEVSFSFLHSASGLLGVWLGGSIIHSGYDYATSCGARKVGILAKLLDRFEL